MLRVSTPAIVSVTTSNPVVVNAHSNLPVGWQVKGITTATFSIEGTLDNVLDPTVTPVWFSLPSASALTTNQGNFYAGPLAAIRINVTAWTAGNVVLTVLQGSPAA